MKAKEEGKLLNQVEEMHKAIMGGDGNKGMLAEWNMWKGGITVIAFILGSGVVAALII